MRFNEQEWEEFKKRFSIYNQEEEKTVNGLETFLIALFLTLFLLCVLKAWGFIW